MMDKDFNTEEADREADRKYILIQNEIMEFNLGRYDYFMDGLLVSYRDIPERGKCGCTHSILNMPSYYTI